jgi:thiol-disulfide isomerase/thioredoxin
MVLGALAFTGFAGVFEMLPLFAVMRDAQSDHGRASAPRKTARGIAHTMAIGKTRRAALALLAATLVGVTAVPASAEGPPLTGIFGERFKMNEAPERAPDKAFMTRDGHTVRLSDFRGQVLLVNFWATWCAPCIEEMPTLDALAGDMNSERFHVLAVSTDRGGREKVEPFVQNKLNIDALDIYLDKKSKLARAFGLRGMPTTYLIGADGAIIGYLEGAADWNSASVKKLIRYYTERAGGA